MKLKQYLLDYNLTQAAFASVLGCTPNYVNMMCRGIRPSRLMAKEIERVTDRKVTFGEMMEGRTFKAFYALNHKDD